MKTVGMSSKSYHVGTLIDGIMPKMWMNMNLTYQQDKPAKSGDLQRRQSHFGYREALERKVLQH
jgi:hypothetical protein